MLPKLGINRHFSSIMSTVPTFLGGLGLPKFELEQAIQHLNYFLLLYNSTSQLGQLLHAKLEYSQLNVGTTNCFLLESYCQQHHFIHHTWICTIWEFLYHYKLLIKLHEFPLPQPQREFDISIMDAIIQSSVFNL